MKGHHYLLICLLAAGHANAHLNATGSEQSVATAAATADAAARTAPAPNKIHHRSAARASLSKIKGGVVKEIKATSAFVQQQAANTESSDGWLIALVALGLIVLQLRRKHKSLPQRRIIPHG